MGAKTFILAAACLAAASSVHAAKPFNASIVLSGAQEVPPVETRTSGRALVQIDRARTGIRVKLDVRDGKGLLGAAGAHLHCAPAGQNGPVVAFIAGVLSGGVDGRLKIEVTLSQANIVNAACGATLAELADSIDAGDVYINVHSIENPSGVVRGQI